MTPRETLQKALENAFPGAAISGEHLVEDGERILGWVEVTGSDAFSEHDDLERQDMLWRQLEELVPPGSLLNFGPIAMRPIRPRRDQKVS